MLHRMFSTAVLVTLALILVACGGGGGSSPQPSGYIVSGIILDENEQPVEGVKIAFSDSSTTVETDGEGKWSREGLDGTVTVIPSHEEYEFEPKELEVSEAADDVDFAATLLPATPYTVSGTVSDEFGEPIAGVRISFSDTEVVRLTNEEGIWTSPELIGRVAVDASHTNYVFAPETTDVTRAADDVDFVGELLYTVSGKVVDEDDNPLSDADVRFIYEDDEKETVQTNDDGTWTSPTLRGSVDIEPSHDDYGFDAVPKTVTARDAGRTDVKFTALRPYAMSGTIVDEDGDPIVGAVVSAEFAGTVAETRSTGDGHWTLRDVFSEALVTAADPAFVFDGPHTVKGSANSVDFAGELKACSEGEQATSDASNPCVLTHMKQVQAIEQQLDGYYVLGAPIDAAATQRWNDGDGFDPIGTWDTPFTGTLDGDGYAIRDVHLHVEHPGGPGSQLPPNARFTGLFRVVGSEGTIRNLTLEGGSIYGPGTVGSFAGASMGRLENVHNTASVASYMMAGGLVGGNNGDIEHSSNDGNVDLDPEMNEGIAAGIAVDNSGHIAHTHNTGDVTTGKSLAAGFTGTNGGTIEYSSNSGNVTSTEGFPTAGFVFINEGSEELLYWYGGVAGDPQPGSVFRSYNEGEVRGGDNVAGLVAKQFAGATIVESYNEGLVFSKDRTVGGLVALNDGGSIKRSYNVADVTGEDNETTGGLVGHHKNGSIEGSYNTGNVDSIMGAGGLVGLNEANIKTSYNTGSVLGIQGAAGGIAAGNDGGRIEDSYNTGSLASDFGMVGGIVGHIVGGEITRTYSTAEIAENASGQGSGGIVGSIPSGTVSDSYFDRGKAPDNGHGMAVAGAALKQGETFTDWDFDTVWSIVDGVDYPELQGNLRR